MIIPSIQRRTGVFAAFTALFAVCLSAEVAAAQDTTGVGAIAGVVRRAAGELAEGVRVCALGSSVCATTDADGAFRLEGLRAGSYQLELVPLTSARASSRS